VGRQGIHYITPQSCLVVPVRVVYAVGFGINKMFCVSADNTNLVTGTKKSSQMCNNEVRITVRVFIFIGACNAPHNRTGNAVNTTLKLLLFFLSFFSIYLLVQLSSF
jgi:hypothetical protein